jgi:dihydrofolate synthase / folylpolyglutamate synthase
VSGPGRQRAGAAGAVSGPAGQRAGAGWTPERAERHLRSLELFGMRFGLERMRRMMTALGSPQRRFQTIHVVGTNGKTSTTRMIAAILQAHGLRVGGYTSPHLVSYAERVQVDGQDISTHAFAAAIARAAQAAERVNRTLAEDDHVTQFELMTAAAYWELARREVQVAVVEAGLGGRFDATNVLDSALTVLTNVGLEHTRWLGPTVHDIAVEKLAVLGERSTLVVGPAVRGELLELARQTASERQSDLLVAEAPAGSGDGAGPVSAAAGADTGAEAADALAEGNAGVNAGDALAARGAFQRENFALAQLAAVAYLRQIGIEPRADPIRDAAAGTTVPGRLHVVSADPLTVLDGAHNPAAADALAAALQELLGGREAALVMGVLEDKDAAAMLARLLPRFARAWFTAPPSARALPPAALASLARQLGFERAACEPNPARALLQARAWAAERGAGAAVVATGSVYLVGDLLARERPSAQRRRSGVGA